MPPASWIFNHEQKTKTFNSRQIKRQVPEPGRNRSQYGRKSNGLKKLNEETLTARWRLTVIMYRSIPKPPMFPPGQTPGHLTFLKHFGQIPRYVASLGGQMPYRLELQRGSNPAPSRHVKASCGNKFCKIFSHYEFLVQLVFAPDFNQRHIPR